MRPEILVSEVGPRDGLQSIDRIMPTDRKKAWIAAEAAAGVSEIEVGSFVPPKLLPQLADTAEIVEFARTIPGLTVAVLVPNLRGAEAAIKAGAHKITLPLSVSETHSLANLRRTHDQVIEDAKAIAALIGEQPEGQRPHFEGSLSTVFGCTLEGAIPLPQILSLAERLMAAGCDEVGLSDTTGYADPRAVKEMIRQQGLDDAVRLLGRLDNAAVTEALPRYLGLALPSFNETFGMVYLEALFAGIPILYGRGTGIDGYLEGLDVGAAAEPGNVPEIAAALEDILDRNADLRRTIAAAAGEMHDRFDRNAILARYNADIMAVSRQAGTLP